MKHSWGLFGFVFNLRGFLEFLLWLSGLRLRLGSMRTRVLSLASICGLRIRRCHELWGRSQVLLGSGVAAAKGPTAVAPIQPLALGLPYAAGAALKRKNKKKKIGGFLFFKKLFIESVYIKIYTV